MRDFKKRKWLQAAIFFGTCAAIWVVISQSCATLERSTPPYGDPDGGDLDSDETDNSVRDAWDLDGGELDAGDRGDGGIEDSGILGRVLDIWSDSFGE